MASHTFTLLFDQAHDRKHPTVYPHKSALFQILTQRSKATRQDDKSTFMPRCRDDPSHHVRARDAHTNNRSTPHTSRSANDCFPRVILVFRALGSGFGFDVAHVSQGALHHCWDVCSCVRVPEVSESDCDATCVSGEIMPGAFWWTFGFALRCGR